METIKGTAYPTVSGAIDDVWAASAAYVKRCARDEIGSGLMETAGQSHGSFPNKMSRRSPKELVDAAKRQPRRSYEVIRRAYRYGQGHALCDNPGKEMGTR
jgi:hypothetical protein